MITMIDTLAGGMGGAQLSRPLAEVLKQVTWLAPFAETVSLILVVIVITYFSIVIGELIPKRIAVSKPEDVVTRLSPNDQALVAGYAPLTWLLECLNQSGHQGFQYRYTPGSQPITEEEL
jgi:putative hemolysin